MPERNKRVLVIGSDGRASVFTEELLNSPQVERVYNPSPNAGMADRVIKFNPGGNTFEDLAIEAKAQQIDLVVVSPENPLVEGEGIVEPFKRHGLRIFAPTKQAAMIEASKAGAEEFFLRQEYQRGIVTPRPQTWIAHNIAEYREIMNRQDPTQTAVKASGLAGGKGVIIPDSREHAEEIGRKLIVEKVLAESGSIVVVQERLHGPEISAFALTDGKVVIDPKTLLDKARYANFPGAKDYKRAFDGDLGLNTGGMGSYAPVEWWKDQGFIQEVNDVFLEPTLRGLAIEGRPFVGFLFAGLMMTSQVLRLIEFNARFGDPEAQTALARQIDGDLYEILVAAADGALDPRMVQFNNIDAVCVVAASPGYPVNPQTGKLITGLTQINDPNVAVYHAGTTLRDGKPYTSGGRVLGITGFGDSRAEARSRAYQAIRYILFDGQAPMYRLDIAA